ncbi:UPF0496 protein 4-like [Curcuma longa]|uniref:UPF0496 protein 4-like n=1 Tax=Curcuma longa TaxID=136217 RepID=UPI003D9FA089
MSRPHDAHRAFFPFGNPFRTIFPKGSHQSLKIHALLFAFEQNLTEKFTKLMPEDVSDVLTLSWMRFAIQLLSDAHNDLRTFINELQLPVSQWDEKWIDVYLDSSAKLLDICIALSSRLSRLNQGQLLLQYVLHLVDMSTTAPPAQKLVQSRSYLQEWIELINSKSPKLDACPSIIKCLQGTLDLPKVKSSKGKALMRALYGVKAMTVFVCNVFTTTLSGCPKAFPDLNVSEEFVWYDAFTHLQAAVTEEIRRHCDTGSVSLFKEIESVKVCALRLQDMISSISCNSQPVQDEKTCMNHTEEETVPGKSSDFERQRLRDSVANLADGVQTLGHELDSLVKQTNEFFQLILTGRDALLCNLREHFLTPESSSLMQGFDC